MKTILVDAVNCFVSEDGQIYFEHAKEAVKSAESVGIKTYLYNNEKKDLESLKKFIDENL